MELGQGLISDCHLKFKPCESTSEDCVAVALVFKRLIDAMKITCIGASGRKLKISLGMSNFEKSHASAINTFRHFLHTLRDEVSLPKAARWSLWPEDGSSIAQWPPTDASPEALLPSNDKNDPDVDFVDGDYRRGKWTAMFNRVAIIKWDADMAETWNSDDQLECTPQSARRAACASTRFDLGC